MRFEGFWQPPACSNHGRNAESTRWACARLCADGDPVFAISGCLWAACPASPGSCAGRAACADDRRGRTGAQRDLRGRGEDGWLRRQSAKRQGGDLWRTGKAAEAVECRARPGVGRSARGDHGEGAGGEGRDRTECGHRATADRGDERRVERKYIASGDAGRDSTGGGAVKRDLKRNLLAGLTLVLVLGIGFHVRQTPVQAQAAGVESTPEAQSPEKNKPESNENDEFRKSDNVAKLGKKLGLNADQSATAFEITNFVLLAVLVVWGVLKVLPKTLRDRNAAIQKNLVDARTATEEARARLSSVEDRLAKLDGELAAMRSQAEQDAEKEEKRIRASVEDEKRNILASAEQEIAAATMHAQKQLQQYAAELAIEQAARKLVVRSEEHTSELQSRQYL